MMVGDCWRAVRPWVWGRVRAPPTVLLLQAHPVFDGPHVVAKVKGACGLHPRQDTLPVPGWGFTGV